jgi:MFS family permease
MTARPHAVERVDALDDADPSRWRMLVLLAACELLGMSLWFTGSAVGPQLQLRWALSTSDVGWLTTVVQLGFVAGTALQALLNVVDLVPARALFAASALAGAAANAAFAYAPTFAQGLVWRVLTGFCLAGVYPPAMKMAATWFRQRRGLAVGVVVGALTVGKATPYLVHALPGVSVTRVILAASVAAAVSGGLIWIGYRDGPYPFPARPFTWRLVSTVVADERWRLATGGYLGHMAELYAFWTWIPVFLLASAARRGPVTASDSSAVTVLSFAVIAVGAAGCLWGGLVADRIGRARLVSIAMAVSGGCALLIGATFGASWWLVAPVALVWGVAVIADSAQFSVLVTESVPPHAVGTALAIQTSLGFLLTTVTIQLVPLVAGVAGWRWAFAMLALGPALGIASIRTMVRRRAAHAPW